MGCPGVFGGTDGTVGKVEIFYPTGEVHETYAKFSSLKVPAGGGMSYYAPCGEGYGDPLNRTPEKLLDDVLDGFCTKQRAYDIYGVVITNDMRIDVKATEDRRKQLKANAK